MIQDELRKIFIEILQLTYPEANYSFDIEIPQDASHGDFATNIAMKGAKILKLKPRDLAQSIVSQLQKHRCFTEGFLASVAIAGPGFINLFLGPAGRDFILLQIDKEKTNYGKSASFAGQKALIEFVSANPTGPLHVGHGRGAVVGDTIANLLAAAGYEVTKEYYINDGGVQINTLGKSLWVRSLQMAGVNIPFPEDAYQGDYIATLAKSEKAREIIKKHWSSFQDQTECAEGIRELGEFAGDSILNEIKEDLQQTGVVFDHYFKESNLYKNGFVKKTLDELQAKGATYEKDNALWLASTAHGDDKDRVLIKNTGEMTYLSPDIAYHREKYSRGYDRFINVWGADHAGYITRLKAALTALGLNVDSLHVAFIQMVRLIKGGEMVSMSTRRATYETLEEVRNTVGRDVVRYFFLMRSHNAQLDFDVELARTQSQENPVYYVQYAHARVCAIFRKAQETGIKVPGTFIGGCGQYLRLSEERQILNLLAAYPEVILTAARECEPHRITYYVMDLARVFQQYYSLAKGSEEYRVITDNKERTGARLMMLRAVQQVFANAFRILGISAPEQM